MPGLFLAPDRRHGCLFYLNRTERDRKEERVPGRAHINFACDSKLRHSSGNYFRSIPCLPAFLNIFHRFRTDYRVDRHKLSPLAEILLLVVCAVLSGAEGWEAMEEFGQEKLDGLRKSAPFANGIPSHDGIATVISRLRPTAFHSGFVNWTRAVAEATGGEVVAVDGKTARGSRDRRRGKQALHLVQRLGLPQPSGARARGDREEIQRDHGHP